VPTGLFLARRAGIFRCVSAPSHEPWKDTAAVHTRHDTPQDPRRHATTRAAPIRHAHPPITYPETWLGELYRHAERLTDVRVTRDVLGLYPWDEPLCPTDFRNEAIARPQWARDLAWRYLIGKIRTEQGNWWLYAVAAMVPGLTGKALDLAPKGSSKEEIDQAYRDLIGQFLVAIEDLGADEAALNAPNVPQRLLGRAEYHTRTRYHSDGRYTELDDFTQYEAETISRVRRRPRGHPDFVLRHMVTHTQTWPDGYRIDDEDAELVARSHMEYVGLGPNTRRKTVADAAAELGIEPGVANMRRWRAEVLIARLMWRYRRWYKFPDAAAPPEQPAA
jgi:hypothetical protein